MTASLGKKNIIWIGNEEESIPTHFVVIGRLNNQNYFCTWTRKEFLSSLHEKIAIHWEIVTAI